MGTQRAYFYIDTRRKEMRKRAWALGAIAIIALSGLTNIALPLAEDPKWTPYVMRWNEKLHPEKKRIAKKQEPIPLCSPEVRKLGAQR